MRMPPTQEGFTGHQCDHRRTLWRSREHRSECKGSAFGRDRPGSRLVRQTSNSAVAGLPMPTADAPSSCLRSAVKFSARDSSAHVRISVYLQSSTTTMTSNQASELPRPTLPAKGVSTLGYTLLTVGIALTPQTLQGPMTAEKTCYAHPADASSPRSSSVSWFSGSSRPMVTAWGIVRKMLLYPYAMATSCIQASTLSLRVSSATTAGPQDQQTACITHMNVISQQCRARCSRRLLSLHLYNVTGVQHVTACGRH
jgi:hypothetical protein